MGHSLAIKRDGGVVAWGDNAYGQATVPSGLGGGIEHGAITCASPVEPQASSACTIVSDAGYHLSMFTVNGVDRLAEVTDGSYTILDVQQDQTVVGDFALNTVPGTPTIGPATASQARAVVVFTPPLSDGGTPITGYTVISDPGGFVGRGATSPITVPGLSNGTA